MTATDDYPGEMPAPSRIDDPIAEALLAGRPVHTDLEPLATAVRALREVSQQPAPPPSAALAAMMAAGAFPAEATAPPQPRGWFARRAAGLRRLLIGRARGARLAVRLGAVGLAVGLIGVGGVGFAGSLPEPVQARFETVVEAVTPYRFVERPAGDAPARLPGVPSAPGGTVGPADQGPPGPAESGGPGEAPGPGATQPPAGPLGPADPPAADPADPPAADPADPPGRPVPDPGRPGGGPSGHAPGPPQQPPGPPNPPPGQPGEPPGQGGRP